MYPLDDPVLTFGDIARHWSREQPPGTTEGEVLDHLLSAFWRGNLSVTSMMRREQKLADHQMIVLESVTQLDDHPGLLVIRPGAEIEPMEAMLPDGRVEIDLRIRITWPQPEGFSLLEARQSAYNTLAEASFASYSSLLQPVLYGLSVEREAFASFCAARGYPRPRFWFAPSTKLSSAAANGRCRRWLREQAQKRDKPGSKAEIRSEALRRFPGLSSRAFGRVWAEEALPSWTRSGAPKGRRKSTMPRVEFRRTPR